MLDLPAAVTESCDGLRAENLSAAASSRSAESCLAAESSAHVLDVGWLSLKESPPSGRAWSARSGGTVLRNQTVLWPRLIMCCCCCCVDSANDRLSGSKKKEKIAPVLLLSSSQHALKSKKEGANHASLALSLASRMKTQLRGIVTCESWQKGLHLTDRLHLLDCRLHSVKLLTRRAAPTRKHLPALYVHTRGYARGTAAASPPPGRATAARARQAHGTTTRRCMRGRGIITTCHGGSRQRPPHMFPRPQRLSRSQPSLSQRSTAPRCERTALPLSSGCIVLLESYRRSGCR